MPARAEGRDRRGRFAFSLLDRERRKRPAKAGNRSNQVARIAGVNLPTNKRVVIALQYIHGIGQKKAHEIMEKLALPAERRVSQLTDQEVLHIREMIDRDYVVEGDLRREASQKDRKKARQTGGAALILSIGEVDGTTWNPLIPGIRFA